ncbi:MAG: zinc ABC transporter substrate-binding protein [Wenzhouxiangellaceae bacterium]|nr:zinc ABC transporter substrate-binding protein [Wenzhouxiangellaceae bacterium]
MKTKIALLLFAVAAVAGPAHADLNVFACEPEWGALAAELAGDTADIAVATTAQQDPHYIQARPGLIARVREADLVVCTGAQLEIGWLPLLLRRASNPKVNEGSEGHFAAADHVRKLDVPSTVSRAQGDIHPSGNPHIHLDPRNVRLISRALAERMAALDPANADLYAQRRKAFEERWAEAVGRWEERVEPLEGMRLISHHTAFRYLAEWAELEIVDHLEPKPGLPPTSGHLSGLLDRFRANPPVAVVRTPYSDPRPSQWLVERLAVPDAILPYTVGGAPGADDLFGLFEVTISRLEQLAK